MTERKERPVLFSGPMVRAFLEDRKGKTRRVIQPQPPAEEAVRQKSGSGYSWIPPSGRIPHWRPAGPVWAVRELMGREPELRCPYGAPGDRLWVRETWALEDCGEDGKRVVWQADRAAAWAMPRSELGETYYLPSDHAPDRWRPSIHMPRWASRLTLEVTDVRVERLQAVSADDAVDEGINPSTVPGVGSDASIIAAFHQFWDSINGERPGCSWEANPYVWVVSFRRLP